MTETRDAFFIVWSPTGAKPPKHRHDDYIAAVREAERLATANPGAEFYVMAAQTLRIVDNMHRVDFAMPMPF